MANIDVLTLTPGRPQSADYLVGVRGGSVVAIHADAGDELDVWHGITGSGDETTKLATFFEYCVENSKRAILTRTTYTVSGQVLASTSRTGVRRLAVHATVPCTITVDAAATAFDFFMYLQTTAENFIDWSGSLVTFNGSGKCGNFLRADNNGADNTGDVVLNPAPRISNIKRASVGAASGFFIQGPYRRIYAFQPQVDTVERASTGECSGFTATGFTGEAVVVEPIISRVLCPSGQQDADGVKLFGKILTVDAAKRAGKATVYGGIYTDNQGRQVKFQCSEGTVIRPLSIRQNVVSIEQSVDFDFQHGNGVLDAPKFHYKKSGATSPLGASHSPVAFQQVLGDEDMISVCRDAEMWTEADMPLFCLVFQNTTSRASISRVTGLRLHQSGFSTRVFTRAIMEVNMATVAAKSYETTLEVSDCQGPFGLYAIGYTGYTTGSLASLLNVIVRDNINTSTAAMYVPWYALSGNPVRLCKTLLLRNNTGWRSRYYDYDLSISTMTVGCVITTSLESGDCTVAGKPTTWTAGDVTWECRDCNFGLTDRMVVAYHHSHATNHAISINGGTSWKAVAHAALS